jgi:hypothetical protein
MLMNLGKLTESSLRVRACGETPLGVGCAVPPKAHYRGAENRLYRVEIHQEGTAANGATFKWSRDNGSVVTAWIGQEGNDLTVSNVPGATSGFPAGQWVELTDDELDLRGRPGTMVQVVKAGGDTVTIDPKTASGDVNWHEKLRSPKIRRWDQGATCDTELSSGAVPFKEGEWLDLEDGVQIWFEENGTYKTGDYWLIPARTATGDVEWPKERDEKGKMKRDEGNPIPAALPPHGIQHHYALLAIISVEAGGDVKVKRDCTRRFEPLAVLAE